MYDFTVTGKDRNEVHSLVAGEKSLGEHRNTRLVEAIRLLVEALPEKDRDVKVTVNGDLEDSDREHTVTVTVSSSPRGPEEEKRVFTPEEQQANLDRKRQDYRDMGRHTTNDEGQVTDVNALPVARLKDDVSLSDRAVADARRRRATP